MKKKSYKYKLYPKKILRHFSPAQVSFFLYFIRLFVQNYVCLFKTKLFTTVCSNPLYILCLPSEFIFIFQKKDLFSSHVCNVFELPSNKYCMSKKS